MTFFVILSCYRRGSEDGLNRPRAIEKLSSVPLEVDVLLLFGQPRGRFPAAALENENLSVMISFPQRVFEMGSSIASQTFY